MTYREHHKYQSDMFLSIRPAKNQPDFGPMIEAGQNGPKIGEANLLKLLGVQTFSFASSMTLNNAAQPDRIILRSPPVTARRGRDLVGVDGPHGIVCAKVRSLKISEVGDRPWNKLAALEWIPRNTFFSFTG